MNRNRLVDREVAGAGALHQLERVKHRQVGGVVAAEFQHVQKLDQTTPVVVHVRCLQRRAHGAVVLGALRAVLAQQLLQRLLATRHSRIHHPANNVVGTVDGGLGDREQNVLFAAHLLERVRQLLRDPAARRDKRVARIFLP